MAFGGPHRSGAWSPGHGQRLERADCGSAIRRHHPELASTSDILARLQIHVLPAVGRDPEYFGLRPVAMIDTAGTSIPALRHASTVVRDTPSNLARTSMNSSPSCRGHSATIGRDRTCSPRLDGSVSRWSLSGSLKALVTRRTSVARVNHAASASEAVWTCWAGQPIR